VFDLSVSDSPETLPAERSASRGPRGGRISGELENGFEAFRVEGAAPIEIACRVCGQTGTETAAALMPRVPYDWSGLRAILSSN
jgi:hypothetical protein